MTVDIQLVPISLVSGYVGAAPISTPTGPDLSSSGCFGTWLVPILRPGCNSNLFSKSRSLVGMIQLLLDDTRAAHRRNADRVAACDPHAVRALGERLGNLVEERDGFFRKVDRERPHGPAASIASSLTMAPSCSRATTCQCHSGHSLRRAVSVSIVTRVPMALQMPSA